MRIIALGNPDAGDDAAAIEAARRLETDYRVVIAGRPGAGLLDLLDGAGPTVLVDVTRTSQPSGQIIELPLATLADAAIAEPQLSSHGFGPSEALRLGQALGRAVPPGRFVGIEGERFEVGQPLSPAVSAALDDLVAAIRAAAAELGS